MGNPTQIRCLYQPRRLIFGFGLVNFSDGVTETQQVKIILSTILLGLMLHFQSIDNHTMSDINKIIEDQKREIEARLALVSSNNLSALMVEREGYEANISETDAKI